MSSVNGPESLKQGQLELSTARLLIQVIRRGVTGEPSPKYLSQRLGEVLKDAATAEGIVDYIPPSLELNDDNSYQTDQGIVSYRRFTYNPLIRIVKTPYSEEPIALSKTQGRIFHKLIANAPNVVPYAQIADFVWGNDPGDVITIKTHITHLRYRIGDTRINPAGQAPAFAHITAVHSLGYRFQDPGAN